jgi:cell division protein FtsW
MKNRYKQRNHSDYLISLVVFALIAFGLIMIYSVSKYLSLQITDGASDKYYLSKQLVSLLIGVVGWVVFQNVDYHFWQKKSGMMLLLMIVMLLSVFIFGDTNSSGAQRWIIVFGQRFQPSEFVKLFFIIYLSGWFAAKEDNLEKIDKSFWLFLVIIGVISFFLLEQKDLGTLSIIVGIAAGIYFAAGASLKKLGIAGIFGGLLFWLAIRREPYRMQRILAFINPEAGNLTISYHIRNALIAIGSGGLFGLGFGQSRQKYLYLPEAHTDSIFAIIAEELGFIGAAAIIFAIAILAIRGFRIAKESSDVFGRLLATGITVWIIFQSFVNIAAMLSLIPLTGVPLPFISFGGTNLIVTLAAVGILQNISKNRRAQ